MTDPRLDHSRADEALVRRQAVSGILKGVAQKTSLIVLGAAAVSLAYSLIWHSGERWWFLPLSVLFGGALGLLNFRWLAVAVERIYLRKGATPGVSNLAAAIIGVLKLSIIFIILFIVIKWQLLHVFGLVGGLSLCFLAILWEGAMVMKQSLKNGAS
jgi:ATP synthase I chain